MHACMQLCVPLYALSCAALSCGLRAAPHRLARPRRPASSLRSCSSPTPTPSRSCSTSSAPPSASSPPCRPSSRQRCGACTHAAGGHGHPAVACSCRQAHARVRPNITEAPLSHTPACDALLHAPCTPNSVRVPSPHRAASLACCRGGRCFVHAAQLRRRCMRFTAAWGPACD